MPLVFGSCNGNLEWDVSVATLAHLTAMPGQTETMMLSVAAHMRQAYVRRSKPGLSGSRSERIIGASQSAQNGRSLVALP
jgi:hypothetical protein